MLKLYSIKDTKIGYMAPFIQQNKACAIRTFKNMRNASQPNAVNTNPEDKELWELGTYDEETGEIKPNLAFIGKAEDYVEPTNKTE